MKNVFVVFKENWEISSRLNERWMPWQAIFYQRVDTHQRISLYVQPSSPYCLQDLVGLNTSCELMILLFAFGMRARAQTSLDVDFVADGGSSTAHACICFSFAPIRRLDQKTSIDWTERNICRAAHLLWSTVFRQGRMTGHDEHLLFLEIIRVKLPTNVYLDLFFGTSLHISAWAHFSLGSRDSLE